MGKPNYSFLLFGCASACAGGVAVDVVPAPAADATPCEFSELALNRDFRSTDSEMVLTVGALEVALLYPSPDGDLAEGPLRVRGGKPDCELDIGIINRVWKSSNPDVFLIGSYSGSEATVDLIDIRSCERMLTPVTYYASELRIDAGGIHLVGGQGAEGGDLPDPDVDILLAADCRVQKGGRSVR